MKLTLQTVPPVVLEGTPQECSDAFEAIQRVTGGCLTAVGDGYRASIGYVEQPSCAVYDKSRTACNPGSFERAAGLGRRPT